MKYLLHILTFLVIFNIFEQDAWASRTEVINSIIKAADFVGVPRELPLAICWAESSYRENLPVVKDGTTPSYGICQLKMETAQWVDKVYKHKYLATPTKLQISYFNALYACKYLKLLLKRYKGNWEKAVDAYNKGHVVSRNSLYVRRVKARLIDCQEKAGR